MTDINLLGFKWCCSGDCGCDGQERRNNLAKLRKSNLTGLPAKLYDEAQRDAEGK